MCLPLGAPIGLQHREYSAFSVSVLQPPGSTMLAREHERKHNPVSNSLGSSADYDIAEEER